METVDIARSDRRPPSVDVLNALNSLDLALYKTDDQSQAMRLICVITELNNWLEGRQ